MIGLVFFITGCHSDSKSPNQQSRMDSPDPLIKPAPVAVKPMTKPVVVTATPDDTHLNPAGTVHGGLAATLLDSCMGLAIWSTLEKGIGQTTLEFKISLVRPITPETGVIRAEGVELNRGRRVGTAEGRITDDRGRLLAHGTTTCLIFEG